MNLNGQWLRAGVIACGAANATVAVIEHIMIASGIELLTHLQYIHRTCHNAPLAGLAFQGIDTWIGLVFVP